MNLLLTRLRGAPRCGHCHRVWAIRLRDRFLFSGLPGGISVVPVGLLIILSHMSMPLVAIVYSF